MMETDLRLLESEVKTHPMLLQGLTSEQQAVVLAPVDESLLVAASPGAGKTHTLLARLAYLVQRRQLVYQDFLFVTFSRAGVEEAKDRLERMPGLDALTKNGRETLGKSFQTLHGIGRRLVESAESATLMRICQRRPHMRVLSHTQRRAILREAIERYRRRQQASLTQPPSCPCPLFNEHDLRGLEGEEAGLATEHDPKSPHDRLVKEISVQIAERKATFIPPPALELDEETAFQWPLVDFVYALYEKWLQHLNCIDFDDMIVMAVKLLEADAHWPTLFPNGLNVILVDEFQDTSASQLRLLRALVQRYASSICAAGDDDQCIYEWRQARPQFMTEFSRFFPRAKLLFLRQSFRCPLNVAHCANALIQHNERRLAKSIDPLPEHEHIRVRIIVGRCFDDEIAYIQRELVHLHSSAGIPWRSMAILCRIAQPLEVVRSALKQAGIPYAGADQMRIVAREPQIDPRAPNPTGQRRARVARSPQFRRALLSALLLLMVNEFDLHLLDNACRVYAPSMHALTKACIGQEGQRCHGAPIMHVVRNMVHHAAAFFEGFQDGAVLDSEQDGQSSGRLAISTVSERLVPGFKRASAVPTSEDRPKLSRGQWKACRALLSAYERLLVLAREQGSDIRLMRMLGGSSGARP
ncbi:hypothetical protein F1559_003193 [Cyanidiococcus yangmingshanensis]|uniref:UvrD-like helicase ATP-binding domain-containing protein n=1 Tax=Cyanidiococcus yangmingshanensis TaxID=2690220 RepID=A0A7J7IN02_9RHOD|nr:hypothetical protein F1559_003193 [Cyanidiococcus yangmingshanensis]